MKLVSFSDNSAGILLGEEILSIALATSLIPTLSAIPQTVLAIIETEGSAIASLRAIVGSISTDAAMLDKLRQSGALLARSTARLAAPITKPQQILATGMNYTDHLDEMNTPRPTHPYSFVKSPSAITGDGSDLILPQDHGKMVDWEAELAVVIGKPCHRVSLDEALNYVAGYMASNDVSARDWAPRALSQPGGLETVSAWAQNLLGKQYPTFCPMGPVFVTQDEIDDPNDLDVKCRVNGVTMQKNNTKNMVFSTAELISYYSQFYVLVPGDIILTGTMGGVGFGRTPQQFLKHGDTVEIEISQIGVLTNSVRAS